MAAPAQRKRPQPEEDASTRQRLLGVALEAFAELGYDGASTRVIAQRAGVNQGLISYYFGSKEKLWREAVDAAFAEMRREFEPVLGTASPGDDRERIELLIRRLVRFVARRPEFTRLMSDEGKHDGPRMRWIVERHARPLFETMQGLIERAGPVTRLPAAMHPLHAYYMLVGAVTLIFNAAPECRRLTGQDPADEAVVEAHADALVALFVGAPPRRTRS